MTAFAVLCRIGEGTHDCKRLECVGQRYMSPIHRLSRVWKGMGMSSPSFIITSLGDDPLIDDKRRVECQPPSVGYIKWLNNGGQLLT